MASSSSLPWPTTDCSVENAERLSQRGLLRVAERTAACCREDCCVLQRGLLRVAERTAACCPEGCCLLQDAHFPISPVLVPPSVWLQHTSRLLRYCTGCHSVAGGRVSPPPVRGARALGDDLRWSSSRGGTRHSTVIESEGAAPHENVGRGDCDQFIKDGHLLKMGIY